MDRAPAADIGRARRILALRLGPRARLGLLAGALLAALVAFYGADVLTVSEVQGWIEPAGAWGPILYVPVSAALGCLLVPGPLLAGVSGLLFGPAVGFVVTLTAAVLSSVASLVLARAVGRPGMAELSGPRLEALAEQLEHHGTLAVVVQRLAPGIPDAPLSYLAGLLRIRPRQIALGTLIGSAPRAFSYTALGGTLGDLTSPIAIVALVVLVLTGLVGAELTRRALRRPRA